MPEPSSRVSEGSHSTGQPFNSGVESLDYDEAEHTFIAARLEQDARGQKEVQRRLAVLGILLMLIVGLAVGSIAYSITFLVDVFATWKWSLSDPHWYAGDFALGWLALLAPVTVLALIAALFTLWAPKAMVR